MDVKDVTMNVDTKRGIHMTITWWLVERLLYIFANTLGKCYNMCEQKGVLFCLLHGFESRSVRSAQEGLKAFPSKNPARACVAEVQL